MTGKIDGGAGVNTLDYSGDGGVAATVNLATSTATNTGGFANIGVLVGSSSTADTLIGANATNTWTLSGTNAGTVGTFSFSAVENLTGGTGADTFKITSGSVTGKINGGLGVNTLDYSGDGGVAATVNLATLTATRTGGFASIGVLVGSSSNADMLLGPNATNTWTLTGTNAGTVGTVSFSAVENLTGGTGIDAFKFTTGSLTGKIDGGTGANTLDYSGDGGVAATVNLATSTATRTGGIANIGVLVGSSSTADTLTGPNATNTWTLTGTNAGTVGTFSFSAVENLTGGTGADTFKITSGSVTGKINGGAGVNTLDYSGDGGVAATVNLATSTATRTGGFASIGVLVGSSSNVDALIGPNATNTWTLTGTNAGTVGTFSFSAVENLTGGTGMDTFKITTGSVTGKIDGGAGINTLDYSGDGGVAATVNLATSTATRTVGIANIGVLVGSSSAADTLIGPNATNTWTLTGTNAGTVGTFSFSAVENLTGGTGADAFKFTTGSVTGKIDGGTGANTLDYSGDGGVAATVNLATSTATRTGGFANIGVLVGSTSTADTLIGPNATNTWTLTGTNAGTVGTFSFSAVENLTGGTGVDEFVFKAGVTISGKIDGGGGGDWLDYAAYTTPVAVDLTANTAQGVGGGIARISNVRGGQGGNVLKGNSLGNILIGGNGADTITGGNGPSILIGGMGNDIVTGGSADDIVIGGYTNYDSSSNVNDLALMSILDEWQSANSYLTRIAHIKSGGGLNGTNTLVFGVTVHDDGSTNTLTGGAGMDWFFEGTKDTITDLASGEVVN